MYDSFGWAKVIIWLFIIYIVGRLLYEEFGWLGVAIPVLLIVGLIVHLFFIEPKLQARRYRKLLETNPKEAEKFKNAPELFSLEKKQRQNLFQNLRRDYQMKKLNWLFKRH
jgi:hypothetical protein